MDNNMNVTAQTFEQNNVSQNLTSCPNCGKMISKKAARCIQCGYEMIPEKKCPDCGGRVPLTDTICPTCGCPIESPAQSEQKQTESKSKSVEIVIEDFDRFDIKKFIPVIAVGVICLVIIVFFATRVKVEKVDIVDDSIVIVEGDTIQLSYQVIPEKAIKLSPVWTSTDDTVGTIDRNGVVKAVSPGNCKIYVELGKKTDEISVTVWSQYAKYMEDSDYEAAYQSANNDEEKENARQELLSEYIESMNYEKAQAFALSEEEKKEIRDMMINKYLEEANYTEAYEIAETVVEKTEIMHENIAAYECAKAADALKDPSSFVLRSIYFDSSNKKLVMEISGKNGFGGTATSYWYYTRDSVSSDFELYVTVSDLDEDKIYSWDDTYDAMEKLLKNSAREDIRRILRENNDMGKETIERINKLFENGILDDVKLVSEKSRL